MKVHPHLTDERAITAQAEMERFWDDLDGESDRGMVLSVTAYFEKLLEDCLIGYLKPCKETDELLSNGRELGTFSARNKCCLALRIFSSDEYQVLKLMSQIRNEFAHKILASFDDASISDRTLEMARTLFEANKLVWPKLKSDPARKMFSFTAFCLNDRLWLRAYDTAFHVEDCSPAIPEHTAELLNRSK